LNISASERHEAAGDRVDLGQVAVLQLAASGIWRMMCASSAASGSPWNQAKRRPRW
jgi:hypothetical protein